MSEFPVHPDQVTPEWLSAAFAASTGHGDCTVHSVAWEPIGTGQVGDSVRFRIEYAPQGLGPATLAGKFPAANATSRSTAANFGLYAKEVGFYREVAQHLTIRTPHVYRAEIADGGADFVLLMEDCATATQGDQLAGCSDEQAREAMRQLAGLHGPSWARDAWFTFPWLEQKAELRAMLMEAYPQATMIFAERYADILEPELMRVCLAMGERCGRWIERTPDPLCLIHGDYRLDNMLFDIRNGAEPMAVLDWQTLGVGDPMTDVGYFLGAGIRPDHRARIGNELLEIYRDAMREYEIERSDADMLRGYRFGALHGISTAVFSAAFVKRTERGDAMFLAMARGAALLANEIGALQVLEGGR